jgi:hypothetical protein
MWYFGTESSSFDIILDMSQSFDFLHFEVIKFPIQNKKTKFKCPTFHN